MHCLLNLSFITQDFNNNGLHHLPPEASFKLKSILDQLKDYQRLLDDRHNQLLKSSDFFKTCDSSYGKLGQLEIQFRDFDVHQQNNRGSHTSFLESTLHQLDQVVMDVLGKGNSLISMTGDRKESVFGIKENMMKIENRANSLRSSCHLKNNEVSVIQGMQMNLYIG